MSQKLSAHHGNFYRKDYTKEEIETFIISYIPRIKAFAKKMQIPDELCEDFVSAGILGVIKALNKDHITDRYLSTIISRKIISEMVSCLISYSDIQNVGHGIESPQDIKDFYTKASLAKNADFSSSSSNNTDILNPIFPMSDCDNQEEAIIDKITAEELKQVIVDLLNKEILKPREAAILIYHLGLFGKPRLSFAKIISLFDLHITPECARQIYNRGLGKIRNRINSEPLKINSPQDLTLLKKILEVKKNA